MLQTMIARGDTGLDAGRGFYDWTGLDARKVRADAAARLRAVLATLAALAPGPVPRCRRREELP
jgi:3-hydroxybutyryl-CoA dehydrogenase